MTTDLWSEIEKSWETKPAVIGSGLPYTCNNQSIVCCLCLSRYPSIFGETQGRHCSTTVIDSEIVCHYGSDHDTMGYKWVSGNKPEQYKHTKNICDMCLDILIKDNIIEFNRRYDDFSFN